MLVLVVVTNKEGAERANLKLEPLQLNQKRFTIYLLIWTLHKTRKFRTFKLFAQNIESFNCNEYKYNLIEMNLLFYVVVLFVQLI